MNITAPAIVDITSDNHATMSYKGDGTPIESIDISDATHNNSLSPYTTRIYKINDTTALVIIGIYDEGELTKIYKYNLQNSTLTSDGIYYDSYWLYPRHIAKISDTVMFLADNDKYIFLDVTNGRVLSEGDEQSYVSSNRKDFKPTAFTTALPFNLDTYNTHNGQHYYSYQVGNSIWLLGPNYNSSNSYIELKIVKLNVSISSTGEYNCSYDTTQVVTSYITNYSYRYMVPDIIEHTSTRLKLLVWTSPAANANAYVIVTITESAATVSEIKTVNLGFTSYNNSLPSIKQSGKISDNTHYIIAVNQESYKYGTLCTRKITISNDTVTATDSLLTILSNVAYASIGTSIPINDNRVQVLIGYDRTYFNKKSYSITDINFNTGTIQSVAISDSPSVIANQYSWYPEVIDNTFLCAYPIDGNSYYSLSVAYMDPSDYTLYKRRKNISTKALAVTSGNIGDSVRLAYEGTYNVPGVASGSIYNTDTSYAIAKKAGVLTVSEPQQTSKVYYGTYTGDGTSGKSSSTPMSITFPFAPKMIHMFGTSNTTYPPSINSTYSDNSDVVTAVDLTEVSTSFTADGAWRNNLDYSAVYHKLSSDGKTYSWYTTSTTTNSISGIFNMSSTIYHYVAFG